MTGNASTRAVGTEAAGRSEPKPPTPMGGASVSEVLAPNSHLIAELQAVTLAITIFGLDALPQIMVIGQDNGPPLDVIDSPYDDCDPDHDDEEEDVDDCGLMASGQCVLAGTEWCDWSCPRGGLALRQAARQASNPTAEGV